MALTATYKSDAARRRRFQRILAGYFFISPGLLGLALFLVGPLIYSLWLSLTEWDIISPPVFVGLENFRKAFLDDKLFWISLYVTVRYTLVAVPLTLIAALGCSSVAGPQNTWNFRVSGNLLPARHDSGSRLRGSVAMDIQFRVWIAQLHSGLCWYTESRMG